ncbi:unnamed protein product, partial [Prorocentrum cordatum]
GPAVPLRVARRAAAEPLHRQPARLTLRVAAGGRRLAPRAPRLRRARPRRRRRRRCRLAGSLPAASAHAQHAEEPVGRQRGPAPPAHVVQKGRPCRVFVDVSQGVASSGCPPGRRGGSNYHRPEADYVALQGGASGQDPAPEGRRGPEPPAVLPRARVAPGLGQRRRRRSAPQPLLRRHRHPAAGAVAAARVQPGPPARPRRGLPI